MLNCAAIWDRTRLLYHDKPTTGETFKYTFKQVALEPKWTHTTVKVESCDMVEKALLIPGCLMLNMANAELPGGYPHLTGAQEEDLFRRSNLFQFLEKSFYPIRDNTVLLAKNVEFYAYGLRKQYTPYEKPAYLNIISCPGVKNTTPGTSLSPSDTLRMKIKLTTLFEAAYAHGYKDLVLSALGCGGFACPPEHVSLLFKQVIQKFKGCFETITFCIIDENYIKCNYRIFKDTLQSI